MTEFPFCDPTKCRQPFSEFLKVCDDGEHAIVFTHFEELRTTTATCRQAVVNFEAERLLPCRFWYAFIDCLEPAAGRPIVLVDRIRDHMRRWSLSGPEATIGTATIFGRAVTHEALADVFCEQKLFGTIDAALRNISDAENLDVGQLQHLWAQFDLGACAAEKR